MYLLDLKSQLQQRLVMTPYILVMTHDRSIAMHQDAMPVPVCVLSEQLHSVV